MGRLRRFLHIEGARPDRPPSSVGTPATIPDEATRERFSPTPEPTGVVEQASADEQPFVRCQRCERDQHRFATTCNGCGASLTTDSQRAFNAALWAQTQAARANAQPEEDVPRHVIRAAQEELAAKIILAEARARNAREVPVTEAIRTAAPYLWIAACALGLLLARGFAARLLFGSALAFLAWRAVGANRR